MPEPWVATPLIKQNETIIFSRPSGERSDKESTKRLIAILFTLLRNQ